MTIRYLSFDFDGCLFPESYINAPHENFKKHLGDAVIYHNQKLLKQIRLENKDFSNAYAFIGSSRQSMGLDRKNAGSANAFKGSCCSAIKIICDNLKINLDPFMLADIYGNLEGGESFERIMNELANDKWIKGYNEKKHANCTVDEFKRTLLFAQLQKAAADQEELNPSEPIVFDFFDDRIDILSALNKYFEIYPHMIPKNVTLRLNHYKGNRVTPFNTIIGTGCIYKEYREIVFYIHQSMSKNLHALDKITKHMKSVNSEYSPLTQQHEKVIPLMREVFERGLYLTDREMVNNFLETNPHEKFVARPSTVEVEGLVTFTVAFKHGTNIHHKRYGLDLNGSLFSLSTTGEQKAIEMLSSGFIATLEQDIDLTIENENSLYTPYPKNFSSMTPNFKEGFTKKTRIIRREESEELEKSDKAPLNSLLHELIGSGLVFSNQNKGVKQLQKNPSLNFFLRPSSINVEGYLTITASFMTNKGLCHQRYGITDAGKLYLFTEDNVVEKEIKSEGLIATFAEMIADAKKAVAAVDDLSKVAFRPAISPAVTENTSITTKRDAFFNLATAQENNNNEERITTYPDSYNFITLI